MAPKPALVWLRDDLRLADNPALLAGCRDAIERKAPLIIVYGLDQISEGIRPLDEEQLAELDLSAAGQTARSILLTDLRLLRDQGLAPELNCIHAYPRDEAAATVPTDVYSFHADRAPIEAATWLCTYHGAASEGLDNAFARRRMDDPATRAALLREYGGADDDGFREFLRENCYDLHYAPQPGAHPYPFGLFNLWRIAVDWPGSPVPPCIHRAPDQPPGASPRLLLIS